MVLLIMLGMSNVDHVAKDMAEIMASTVSCLKCALRHSYGEM